MKYSLITPSYVVWHYTTALKNIWGIITNFIWFSYHFFSVPIFAKNLFAPWYHLGNATRGNLSLGTQAFIFFVEVLMRLVGFVIRLFTILFAVFIIICISIFGVLLYIFWLLYPVILIMLVAYSIFFLSL